MRVLGIEASTAAGSVALVEGQDLAGEVWFAGAKGHSERLMGSLAVLFRTLDFRPALLDGVAVGLGPGSFTGVRVALSTAKGLAFGLGVPLVGVPTLDALAGSVPFWSGLICPMVDARAERVYGALFRFVDGHMEQLEGEGIRDLVPWISGLWGPVLFLGDGALRYRQRIQEVLGDVARFVPWESTYPRASVVARLGARRLDRGESDDLDLLVPRYIQDTQAERELRSRQWARAG